MRPKFTVSRTAVDLIMAFEGFHPDAMRLNDGRWMIGFGHTRTARAGVRITEADAEALLSYDLIGVARMINENLYAPISQNQFDALCSFAFNIGDQAFLSSPTLRRLNEGRPLDAAAAMELFRKADFDGDRIVVDALVRRRAAEKALFLRPPDGWMESSTPVLPPQLDYDLMSLVPLTSSVAARAVTDGDRIYAEREATPETATPGEEDDTALASETAAAAVIERLEAMFAEPEPAAPIAEVDSAPPEPLPPSPTFTAAVEPAPAPAPAPEPQPLLQPFHLSTEPTSNEPDIESLLGPRQQPTLEGAQPTSTHPDREAIAHVQMTAVDPARGGLLAPVLIVALGLIGVGLLALAAIWALQPASDQILGMSPRTAGLGLGTAGIAGVGLAAYLMLERLGLPRPPR
jgi:lysozyme